MTNGGALQLRNFVVAANEKAEVEISHIHGLPSGQFLDTGAVIGDSVLIGKLQTPIYQQDCQSQGVVLPYSSSTWGL